MSRLELRLEICIIYTKRIFQVPIEHLRTSSQLLEKVIDARSMRRGRDERPLGEDEL
jgi:hypothetical protein